MTRHLRGARAGHARLAAVLLALAGCEAAPPRTAQLLAHQSIPRVEFAGLVDRISEPGGYFDTDNLISNEAGYLKVMGALRRRDAVGGAYVGVGPDQNYSYIAEIRPAVAFIIDVRRDNLLHHLLLKALIERAPTRLEFLTGLHGRPVPPGAIATDWDLDEIIEYLDDSVPSEDVVQRLTAEIAQMIEGYGAPLSAADHETVRRFHRTFIDAGLGLRFTTFGRPPRPYYPTFRRLILETDIEGEPQSYLADRGRYEVVRSLHLANRIIPVVGDLAGPEAMRELGAVLREMGVAITTFYASNVEYYLWNAGTFERWRDNMRELPRREGAVLIRSYFPNFARAHPSAVDGYYSTQVLQPVDVLLSGDYSSYWDVVTRGVLDLR